MNGNWLVDAVQGAYCSQMNVSGPTNKKAWAEVKSFAQEKGVVLSLGSCESQGYDHVVANLAPKTFSKDGYVAKWNGQLWAK